MPRPARPVIQKPARASLEGSSVVLIAVLVVLLAVSPTFAADAVKWGPTLNGLRMSVALNANESGIGPSANVTIQNIGSDEVLMPLGVALRSASHPDELVLFPLVVVLLMTDEKEPKVVQLFPPVTGRPPDRLVVPLIPGASYSWKSPLDSYVVEAVSGKFVLLQEFMLRPCQLQVELDLTKSMCDRNQTSVAGTERSCLTCCKRRMRPARRTGETGRNRFSEFETPVVFRMWVPA